MVNVENRLIIFFAAEDGEALYSQQKKKKKRDLELTVAQIMNWRRKWQPTPVFLPGESQGQRSLVVCHLWGRTELDMTEVTYHQQQQQITNSLLQNSDFN